MNQFFNYDNKFFHVIGKGVDCLVAGALWLALCLPIVTAGASTTALYYTVHKTLRGNRGYVTRNFMGSFKANFKQTTTIWSIFLVVGAFLFADCKITKRILDAGSGLGAMYYFFYFLMFFEGVLAIYTFAYSARFEDGKRQTVKNAAIMAVLHLPLSFAVIAGIVIIAILVSRNPLFAIILPAPAIWFLDKYLDRVFRKYMSAEDLEREKELDWLNREYD